MFYIRSSLLEEPGSEITTVLGARNYVQLTGDKARHNPRGGQWGSLEGNSLIRVEPPNQHTCTQANSFSQLGLRVLGGRESASFPEQTLFFLACVPLPSFPSSSVCIWALPHPPLLNLQLTPAIPLPHTQVIFSAGSYFLTLSTEQSSSDTIFRPHYCTLSAASGIIMKTVPAPTAYPILNGEG